MRTQAARRKPKGYFLGGVTKGLFGSEDKAEIVQPGYVKKLTGPFVDLVKGEMARPDAETVAPFSADTQSAFDMARNLATNDPTGYNQQLQFGQDAIRSAFSANEPWNEKLVEATLSDYDRSAEMDRARQARNQAGRNAFGDRAFIDQVELDRTLSNDRAGLEARLMEEGINRRTNAATALADLAGQERGNAIQGAGLLETVGTRQDQREQQVLDVPYKRIGAIGPIFGSAPSTTNTQNQQSTAAGLGGLALTGAGLYQSGALGALAGLFANGGEVDAFADGGRSEDQRNAQMMLARALRTGDEQAARTARRILERLQAESDGPTQPSTGEVEVESLFRNAKPSAFQPNPGDALSPAVNNPVVRGIQDGYQALFGEELPERLVAPGAEAPDSSWSLSDLLPDVPEATEAQPAEMPAEAPAAATSPAAPAATPRARVSAFENPPVPKANPDRPGMPRRLEGALNGTEPQAAAIRAGAEVAAAIEPSVPPEQKGAFTKWIENPLTLMGLAMLASDRNSFSGAFGDAGLYTSRTLTAREELANRNRREDTAERLAVEDARRRAAMDAFNMGHSTAELDQRRTESDRRLEIAQEELGIRGREADARMIAAQRPIAGASRDIYLEQLYRQLAELQADPFADDEALARVMTAISLRESGPSSGPALPPGFELE